MKLSSLRISPSTSPLAIGACLSLLAVSSVLSGCANMVATAPSAAPIKVSLSGIKGNVHGGRGPVVGANVYVFSPSLTGYGGSGIAASSLNASTPLLNNTVPAACGAGATATATVDLNPSDSTYEQITSITLTSSGAGYAYGGTATAPSITITDPTGDGTAAATASLATYAGGTTGVGTITVTSGGNGYTAPTVTINPINTGACVDGNGDYYVSSDANGNFALTGDYTCTQGLPVYIYTMGGNSGSQGAGSDGAFMAVLGICPTTGGDMSSLVPYVSVNELTTVAAAYAVAGFATDPLHIGVLVQQSAPSTLTSSLASLQTLELTDLQNAFNTAGNLYPASTGYSGPSPTTTPYGNGTLPNTKLNTLADVLANCVNSVYINYACETLLSYTPGKTDTAGAAIYIAQHPASNVTAIYNLATANGSPWQPLLSAYPADWTVSISYTGGGLSTGTAYAEPHMVNVDASGNVWTVSLASPFTLDGLNYLGVPITGSPFSNSGMSYPSCVIPDIASQNLFICNEVNAADTANGTTISEYNISGNSWTTITPVSGATAELSAPIDLAFDGSGDIFTLSAGTNYVVKLTPNATTPVTYTYSTKATNTTYVADYLALAVEPGTNGNVWMTGEGSGTSKKYADLFTNADVFSTESTADYYESAAISIDASGNAWATGYTTGITKIPAAGGTSTSYAYPSEYTTVENLSSAIDGASNLWVADFNNGYLDEYSNAGALISGTHGYQPYEGTLTPWVPPAKPTTGYIKVTYIAIDGSGNVWSKPSNASTLQEMVGAAVPVVTSTAYATANSLLGQRP